MSLSPDITNQDYTPDGSGTSQQEFNLYYPPNSGVSFPSPAIVYVNLTTDWDVSNKGATITGIREQMARLGFIIVDATVTRAGDTATLGLFRDDSEAEWGTEDTAEFDVMSIIQYLRENSTANGGTIEVDPDNLWLWGDSGPAGSVCLWVAWNADLAVPAHGDAQRQQSSLPAGVVARVCPTWFPAMGDSETSKHFRDEGSPSTQAATYGDAGLADLENGSPIKKLVDNREKNRTVPVYLRSASSAGPDEALGTDPTTGYPTLTNSATSEGSAYFQRIAFKILRNDIDRVYQEVNSFWSTDIPGGYPSDIGNLARGADELLSNSDGVSGWTSDKRAAFAFCRRGAGDTEAADTWDVQFDWATELDVTIAGLRSAHETEGSAVSRKTRVGINRLSRKEKSRRWRIGSSSATPSDVTRIETIFKNSRNGALPINFPSPSETGFSLVQLDGDSFSTTQTNGVRSTWTLELQESTI
jgi:hypothetical protein